MNETRKKSEIPSVIFIMESNSIRGGRKALFGKRKKIEAFDKAFLHHLFIKILCIKSECGGGGPWGAR